MDKRQAEIEALALEYEKQCLKNLQKSYTEALADTKRKLRELLAREPSQSVAYQVNFQRALEMQLQDALDMLKNGAVSNVSDFLNKTYEDSYLGTVYSIQGQGIPINIGIDHEQVARVVNRKTDTLQFSQRLYDNVDKLGIAYKSQMSRGIANGSGYSKIAKQLALESEASYRQAMRIVRTEGGRVKSEAKLDSMKEAKKQGADIVKQWDATFDSKTRAEHRYLDGQVREIDEPFEDSQGRKGMAPHKFGVASMDVNCRCIVVERARWAVEGEDMPTKMDNVTGEIVEAKNYQEWKEKYSKKGRDKKEPKSELQLRDPSTFYSEKLANYYAEEKRMYENARLAIDNPNQHFGIANYQKHIEELDAIKTKEDFMAYFKKEGLLDYRTKVMLMEEAEGYQEKMAEMVKAQKAQYVGHIDRTKENARKQIAEKEPLLKNIDSFDQLAKEKGLVVSKSPYSNSFYAHKEGEIIDWGVKPEGSYRLADHWNWEDRNDPNLIHCATSTGEDYGLAIAQMRGGKYVKIDDIQQEISKAKKGSTALVFDKNSKTLPSVGDMFRTTSNELVEIVEVQKYNGIQTVTLKNGQNVVLGGIKAPLKVELNNMPKAFVDTGRTQEQTQKLVDYVNGLGGDSVAKEILANLAKLDSYSTNNIPFKIVYGTDNSLTKSMRYSGEAMNATLNIPKLDVEDISGAVNTTLHEIGHLVDSYVGTKGKQFGDITETHTKLLDAISEGASGTSDDIMELLKQANIDSDEAAKAIDIKALLKEVDNAYKNGAFASFKEYSRVWNKTYKEAVAERGYLSRNKLNGIDNLQDIYDALSGGDWYDSGVIKYGHGAKYYKQNWSKSSEIFANYFSLSITRPDLIEILKQDKPKLCEALDEILEEILKGVE